MSHGISTFKNLPDSGIISELISYIEGKLPSFTSSEEFTFNITNTSNEDRITEQVCNFLINQRSKFSFVSQTSQGARHKVDIGAYLGANLIFTLEAKILPTPKSKERKEYEYVYGQGGGIERFKNENHGINIRGELLPINGMIGYIKKDSFDHWLNRVNQWISDTSWGSEEHLRKIDFSKIAYLDSNHKRKNGSYLRLHHFWIQIK